MRSGLIPFLFLAFASQLSAQAKPNIIFVLFDDLGYSQPQCYQPNSALRTPNLDKLATEGMRFTDAHTAAAVCTPTRYGVLTGRYPARLGQFGVLTTFSKPIIPPNRMTVASMLKQQGYATACVGKWHLGMDWGKENPGSEKEVPIGARMTKPSIGSNSARAKSHSSSTSPWESHMSRLNRHQILSAKVVPKTL